jgi:hypothetical protein
LKEFFENFWGRGRGCGRRRAKARAYVSTIGTESLVKRFTP